PPPVPPVPVLLPEPPKSSHDGELVANVSPIAHLLPATGSQYGAVLTQSSWEVQLPAAPTRSMQVPPAQRRFSLQGLFASHDVPVSPLAMHTMTCEALGPQ